MKEQAVSECGALVLDDLTADDAGRGNASAALDALMARATHTGVWTLPWGDGRGRERKGASGQVRWGIIPPASESGCSL